MKRFILIAAAMAASSPALAQEHVALERQIEALRKEVQALRQVVERQPRAPLSVNGDRLRYYGALDPGAERKAQEVCRELGYRSGRALGWREEPTGSRRFLTDYMCWDPPR